MRPVSATAADVGISCFISRSLSVKGECVLVRINSIQKKGLASMKSNSSSISLLGIINVWLFGPDGRLLMHTLTRNVIVNTGRARLIDLLDGAAVNPPEYIAVGDSDTAAAASQSALVGTELARSDQLTPSQPDAYTLRLSATFAAGTGTGTWREAAVFCDPAAGTMFARGVIDPIVTKGAADSATVQYDLTYAAG